MPKIKKEKKIKTKKESRISKMIKKYKANRISKPKTTPQMMQIFFKDFICGL